MEMEMERGGEGESERESEYVCVGVTRVNQSYGVGQMEEEGATRVERTLEILSRDQKNKK